jgi:hypothetical protein
MHGFMGKGLAMNTHTKETKIVKITHSLSDIFNTLVSTEVNTVVILIFHFKIIISLIITAKAKSSGLLATETSPKQIFIQNEI